MHVERDKLIKRTIQPRDNSKYIMICQSYVFGLIVKLSKLCNKTNRLECPVLCSVTLDQTTHLSLLRIATKSHICCHDLVLSLNVII